MGRFLELAAVGCALSGVDAKALRWSLDNEQLSWTPARETLAFVPDIQGMSPKVTAAPQANGRMQEGLFKRQATSYDTCAYVNGDICEYFSALGSRQRVTHRPRSYSAVLRRRQRHLCLQFFRLEHGLLPKHLDDLHGRDDLSGCGGGQLVYHDQRLHPVVVSACLRTSLV